MTVEVVSEREVAKAFADGMGVRAVVYYDREIGGYSWMTYRAYMEGERGNVNPLFVSYDTHLGDLEDVFCDV